MTEIDEPAPDTEPVGPFPPLTDPPLEAPGQDDDGETDEDE